MTKDEIENIVKQVCVSDSESYDIPSENDWNVLQQALNIQLSAEYKLFMELMGQYELSLMVLNVIDSDNTNGDDSIEDAYNFEIKNNEHWPKQMIPFVDIGNGDYFCFDRTVGKETEVFYYFHDKLRADIYSNSFSDWITNLPDFLED